ncbi:uncharacterized protein LOC128133526 [Lactuca sativa]|uniref:uncharacterized protein LOC128133526 n=1 Tax=Lactuca sativa TaxID=4236 RepID=UPI000CD8E8D8|nr:uncharacterized protein LOC128133526 [Lactuca sativa]
MIVVQDNDHIDGCYNTPPINHDEQYNELFDNLMENLLGSDEDVEEYEGDDEFEDSDEEYEKDEGDDQDGKQSENEDKLDDIMDEENNIEDVDEDMADFCLNVESDVEGACINDGHEPEDMEVINNDEFKSLDEGSDQDRERRALIKNLGKEKRLRAHCRGVVPIINKGQVGTQPTTSKSKSKEVKTQKETCGWYIHASRSNPESDWFIRTLNQTHTCLQTRKLRACTASLICKKIIDQVEVDPKIPLRAIQDHFKKTYQVGVSMDKVFRAEDIARKHVTEDYTKQFELLREYALELQATNLDTTVKIDVCPNGNPASPTRQFRRIYVCLGPLIKGFKACLRDLVGLDGAFMKGPFPGQVLTSVGLDSNNGIYTLAYAIVESENTASWKWFLENLGDDLELGSNSNYTFISDKQKEIIFVHPYLKFILMNTTDKANLMLCAKSMECISLVGMVIGKYKFKDDAKQLIETITAANKRIWIKSSVLKEKATTYNMLCCYADELNEGLRRVVSDVLISNMCDVFNGEIEKGRDKPAMKKAKGPLTPTATNILDARKKGASQYIVRWNGANKYQVTRALQDQHVVDVRNQTCTCRKWELMGIPCRHAIATLNEISKDPEAELDIYKWVHKVY